MSSDSKWRKWIDTFGAKIYLPEDFIYEGLESTTAIEKEPMKHFIIEEEKEFLVSLMLKTLRIYTNNHTYEGKFTRISKNYLVFEREKKEFLVMLSGIEAIEVVSE